MKAWLLGGMAALAVAAACGSDDGAKRPAPTLVGEALESSANCLPCHAEQVSQWSGSMHAYAAEDPVFIAMNKRMIRETNGASKDFCVKCHAPLAFAKGLTADGTNLDTVPKNLRGVTCYFCHQIDAVTGTNNAAVTLANDGAMRGSIDDPSFRIPHAFKSSPLHNRERIESASLCGACHDVVAPHGAFIERTFDEWKQSIYAIPNAPPVQNSQLACGKCHMEGHIGRVAQIDGVSDKRTVHNHAFPAVDIALTPFPNAEEQRAAVQAFLDPAVVKRLNVQQTPLGIQAQVYLDNFLVGHKFPSGANQDRRAWVELVAEKDGKEIFASGKVLDKKAASALVDPNLWLLRDKIFREDGSETHLFWEAARFEAEQLPNSVTTDPSNPLFNHSVTRNYQLPEMPDHVTMRLRFRPMDFDLLDDLVASGDLDAAILDKMPTFDIGPTCEWKDGANVNCCFAGTTCPSP